MYNKAVLRRLLVVGALAIANLARAADPLTLPQALSRAANSHPDLQGFEAESAGDSARRTLARRLPPTEASLLLEDALGSGERSGLRSAQWTLSFSQALEISGQRGTRLELAEAKGASLAAHQDLRRRDALAEVTQRFIEAAVDAERLRLAEAQVSLAQKTLAEAEARVKAARAPLAESARAKAALAQAVLLREHAEHEEQSARVALAVSMGLREPDFGELNVQLFEFPEFRSLEELRTRLQTSPAAQARLAEAATYQAEQRAASAAAGLRPSITAGVRRYEQEDDLALIAGFSIPLGAARRARDEANIASARLEQSQAENRGALLRAEEQLFDRYQELRHAREALRLSEAEILPAMDEALAQTQYAYDRGRYGYLELSQVLRERAVAQRERLDAAAHFHSLLAELERLTGESLIAGNTP